MNIGNNSHMVQDKLDVINKQRSSLFAWRGQFTPEFVSYILDVHTYKGDIIADPFSGSGTVALEALSKGLNCITYEINPSAFFMTSFFSYCMLNDTQRRELVSNIIETVSPIINTFDTSLNVYCKSENDYRKAFVNLLNLSTLIANSPLTHNQLPYILNVLFRCEKDRKRTLRDSFRDNFKTIREVLYSLPFSDATFSPHLSDARLIGKDNPNSVDMVLTSPPYINVFNYHQNYRGIIECFNYDILKIAHSEIGSNRKNRINRFRTVVEYAIEIGKVIESCVKALKDSGRLILVVGRESMVCKTPFYNSKIILDIIESLPSLSIVSIGERKFTNRFGTNIYEDIIIAQKSTTSEISQIDFKSIGLNHVQNAMEYAPPEARPFIKDVLINNSGINESNIYSII